MLTTCSETLLVQIWSQYVDQERLVESFLTALDRHGKSNLRITTEILSAILRLLGSAHGFRTMVIQMEGIAVIEQL